MDEQDDDAVWRIGRRKRARTAKREPVDHVKQDEIPLPDDNPYLPDDQDNFFHQLQSPPPARHTPSPPPARRTPSPPIDANADVRALSPPAIDIECRPRPNINIDALTESAVLPKLREMFDFIVALKRASLEDPLSKLSDDTIEWLCNPPRGPIDIDNPGTHCRKHSHCSPAEAYFTEYVESPVVRTSVQSFPVISDETRSNPTPSRALRALDPPEMHRTRSHTFGNPSVLCPVRSV
ncbi:hypothetical protein EDB19DRAFT_1915395 [Suillus lakei]|nr:hypothetical protein EDB19DRAFT_1915395 [Suillus lakei]